MSWTDWWNDVTNYFSSTPSFDYDTGFGEGNIGYFGINPDLDIDGEQNITSADWDALRQAGFSVNDLESYGITDPSAIGMAGRAIRQFGKGIIDQFRKPNGDVDWGKVAILGGGILGALDRGKGGSASYQKPIPKYDVVRQQVPQTYDPNRRPGSGGQRYFTDVQYTPKTGEGAAEALTAAQTSAAEQAQGLAALNTANPLNAPEVAYQPPAPPPAAAPTAPTYDDSYSGANVLNTVRGMLNPQRMAKGGIVGLQDGGFVVPADVVSHLGNGSSRAGINHLIQKGAVPIQGKGDGMSDSNRTTINGRQPAAVADGEAYFPPNQVQQMGGAEKLYAMMDQVRKARTGNPKQGKRINPNQYV